MYQLPDLALEAILKEWHPQQYDPPHSDVREWVNSIESLSDTYGIPDVQRPQCATGFIKDELSTELLKLLMEARAKFGSVHWVQFKNFMVAFDKNFREEWEKLPFYKKHPRLTGAALGITGSILLAPATTGVISYFGLTSTSVAAGSVPTTIYGRAAGSLFSLLQPTTTTTAVTLLRSVGVTVAFQPAAAVTVLPSVGTLLTGAGAATTGAGVVVATTNGQPGTSISTELLHQAAECVSRDDNPDDDDDGNLPPYRAAVPEEYLLTPQATLAIVKSWDVWTYNPPGTNCTSWLRKIHKFCERYGIPLTQRAACAMHHMRADCRGAAHAAGCYDMTWDEFTVWLCRYDHEDRKNTNRKIAELSAIKSEM